MCPLTRVTSLLLYYFVIIVGRRDGRAFYSGVMRRPWHERGGGTTVNSRADAAPDCLTGRAAGGGAGGRNSFA